MPTPPEDHTGARIRRLRVLRHLTQMGLAERAHVSYSLVAKVEQGATPATPAFIGAVARALSVSTADITGQPYVDELRTDQLDGLINPVREALDVYDLGADPDIQPRSLADLDTAAEQLCSTIRETNIKKAATELPSLIYEVTTAAYLTPSDDMWRVLASTYRSAYDIATKLGYADLATTALDRLEWAAVRASDAVLSSLRQYLRGLAYLRAAQYRTGKRLIGVGLASIGQADASLPRDVVTGQLHLGAAILAARDQREDDATGHLSEAERIAERTGPAERVLWVSFGPTNVRIHRVSALTELNQYGEACTAAQSIQLGALPPSRIGHHHADVARAQLWAGKPDAAYASLRRARAAAPQQTRYHPMVRQTMEGLASHYRNVPDNFSNYAAWLGM
ncbi:helix-turn-helix domain-containing protein [Streptomyces sp. H27-D2]|uniref:helix-turn-helix domain-containing protein n=1 Tax=Streptomyces sp. H27-D2 TaxID=3046304 RepID=UPI002DBCA490|nr:helix-turn-helix transcriptional regulator [Streptomyces sp. H27-D2]MEC4016200.1 helix-turn-helix transcriptional regulator [Streptomyces sp. H27-D2]